MKRHAAANGFNPLRTGVAVLALCAAALLMVAGGCGSANDDPNPGGLTAKFKFGSPASASASASGGASTQVTGPSAPQEEVKTVVIGALIINFANGSGQNGAYTSNDADGLNDTEREQLEQDAQQSVAYLVIVQLPSAGDTVEFPIPNDGAGNWQLVAVGLRHQITNLDQIQNNSPIWYGFIGQYLNGLVQPGQTLSDTLVMKPGCSLDDPPTGGTCP